MGVVRGAVGVEDGDVGMEEVVEEDGGELVGNMEKDGGCGWDLFI